ncbi:acylphosphatase [Candidatus Sororendozoicomonas aggregata]|uniref:acylphosphatase n=1 Tax=Candidatus Sororendozoicomonas aggregata TaxID=3073239 RepID=UPI002ED55AE7
MATSCKKAWVEGRVQGVCFRISTQKQALELGITGWAKNLPDGRVEVLMCGEPDRVSQLEAWLHEGPPLARVSKVSVVDESLAPPDGFLVG